MNHQELNKNQRGFTLVEILIVVAIIAVILGVGAAGFKSMAEGNPTVAGANNLKSAAKEAQQLAKGQGVRTRLVIYADPSDASPEGIQKFARYYGVATLVGVAEPTDDEPDRIVNKWQLVSKGQYLPVGAFLDTERCLRDKDGNEYIKHAKLDGSDTNGLVDVIDPGNKDKESKKGKESKFFYYEFNAQGIMVDPPISGDRGAGGRAPRVIVNEGKIGRAKGALVLKTELSDERNFRGFHIFRSGKLADITNLKSIDAK